MITTNGLTSWASDLKDIGAIYPFQGAEVLLVVLGLIFWVGWHVIQTRQETEQIEEELRADPRGDKTLAAIDRYY